VERIFTYIESLTLDGRDASLDYKLTSVGSQTTEQTLALPRGHSGAEILPGIAPLGDEVRQAHECPFVVRHFIVCPHELI
jgi:hypothetical protein